jgi:hypothetical protein
VKFRVVRESEFETRKPSTQNPLRGTAYEDKAIQSTEFETAWTVEVADLEALRELTVEMMQVESKGSEPPTVSIDFLPHYEETPADCDGMLFICDL